MIRLLLLSISFLFSSSVILVGQCYPDRHSTALSDGWVSCTITQNPNPDRTYSHWIMYDLGTVESIEGMKIWNGNLPEFPDIGIERFALDYSIDGTNWISLGEYDIPNHTPDTYYQGDDIEDIPAFEAQQVLITAINIKGGTCTGLAEVRFYRGGTTTNTVELETYDVEVFPNPTADVMYVNIEDKNFSTSYYEIIDLKGRIIDRVFTSDKVIRLNLKGYASGQYVIKVIGAGDQVITEQIQVLR